MGSRLLVVAVEDFFGPASRVIGFATGKRTDDGGNRVGDGIMPSEPFREEGEEHLLLCGRQFIDGFLDFCERAHGGKDNASSRYSQAQLDNKEKLALNAAKTDKSLKDAIKGKSFRVAISNAFRLHLLRVHFDA